MLEWFLGYLIYMGVGIGVYIFIQIIDRFQDGKPKFNFEDFILCLFGWPYILLMFIYYLYLRFFDKSNTRLR